MKRAFFSLLLLLSFPMLFASVYKSNALAQKIEEIASLTGIGWELEEIDGNRKLYSDGELLSEKKELPDGYEIIEDSYHERVFLDSTGKVVRRIIKEDDSTEEYNYFYNDKRLQSYTYSVNGKLEKKVDYIFAGNSLSALSGDSRAFFLDEYYVYGNEEDGFIIKQQYEKDSQKESEKSYIANENGKLIEEVDGVVYTYSQDGRIESEVGENYSLMYSYSDSGALVKKEIKKGDITQIEYFSDSELEYIEIYERGVISKSRKCLDSGEVEEIRYLSGIPRYRLVFDLDGRRLKEVTAL